MTLHLAVLHILAASSSSTTKKSSSATFLLFLVVIAAAGYFLLLRPQQQKARKAKETMSQVGVGDEVLTAGGIVGRILEMDDDRFTILTGEDNEEGSIEGTPTRIVMVRSAILRKIEAPAGEHHLAEAELDHDQGEHDDEHETHDDEGESDGRASGGTGP
ncbi:MAG: preprotein translocase subunit YajC [Acidimicrobiales bacterium]